MICRLNIKRFVAVVALLFLAFTAASAQLLELDEKIDFRTDSQKARRLFLDALRQKWNYTDPEEGRKKAMEQMEKAVAKDSTLDAAYFELSIMYMESYNDKWIPSIKKAVELNSGNYWYRDFLATTHSILHEREEAIAVYESLAEDYPKKTDFLMSLFQLYLREDDYEKALSVLDRIELIEGPSEELTTEKFRTYFMLNDNDRTMAELTKLVENYPGNQNYRIMQGKLFYEMGKKKDALDALLEAEKLDSENPSLQETLAGYYKSEGNDSLFRVYARRVYDNEHADDTQRSEAFQYLLYDCFTDSAGYDLMDRMFAEMSKSPKATARMHVMLLHFMVQKNASDEEIKAELDIILNLEPTNDKIRRQRLAYAVNDNAADDIIRLCDYAVNAETEDPVYYLYSGLAYMQKKESFEAIDRFSKGLDVIEDRTKQLDYVVNFYSLMGDAYHDVGYDEAAFVAYDSCLIYRPNDPLVLNNYAYYLALKHKDLKHAEQMSKLAVDQEKDNFNNVDTYAWILFLQKRYDEAKIQIDRALQLMGDDAVEEDPSIVEHAGDIYSKLSMTDKAVEYWTMVRDAGSGSEVLEKKIKKRKYVEK